MLNDAVAIVIVRILQSLGKSGFTHPVHFLVGVAEFIVVAILSLGVAVAVSAASALLLKKLRHELARP